VSEWLKVTAGNSGAVGDGVRAAAATPLSAGPLFARRGRRARLRPTITPLR